MCVCESVLVCVLDSVCVCMYVCILWRCACVHVKGWGGASVLLFLRWALCCLRLSDASSLCNRFGHGGSISVGIQPPCAITCISICPHIKNPKR